MKKHQLKWQDEKNYLTKNTHKKAAQKWKQIINTWQTDGTQSGDRPFFDNVDYNLKVETVFSFNMYSSNSLQIIIKKYIINSISLF